VNKDGKLTREELIIGYKPMFGEMTEVQVDQILHAADFDGNGSIDYNEWRSATLKFNSKISSSRVKEAF
jgi:calcium-dependent protein kinase